MSDNAPSDLRRRREALGLTRTALGKMLDLGYWTIKAYEKGARPDGKPLRQRAMYELALCELERRAAEGRL